MFDWLKRRKTEERMPTYSAIRKTPTRGLPADLAAREADDAFRARRAEIERSLDLPPEDAPLFVELVAADRGGLVSMALPDGSRCLPIFSSIFRAGDYREALLAQGPAVAYLSSNPLQVVAMLRNLETNGIGQLALDHCPRCNILTAIQSASVATADDVIKCWRIMKGGEFARMELYLEHARESARAGRLDVARDVALETVAHVGMEDPRAHFLLGEIAVALGDRGLLGEAKAFLRFFKRDALERRLDGVARSGSPAFELAAS